MIGYSLLAVSSTYRIVLIDASLFGIDVAYTFIVSNATFLILGQFVIYISKSLFKSNILRVCFGFERFC